MPKFLTSQFNPPFLAFKPFQILQLVRFELLEMAENKLPFAKGASIHIPPIFTDINYQFWKIRMKIFIESIDQGIWNEIINGSYTLKHIVANVQVDKP